MQIFFRGTQIFRRQVVRNRMFRIGRTRNYTGSQKETQTNSLCYKRASCVSLIANCLSESRIITDDTDDAD